MNTQYDIILTCPICDREFPYNGVCPECGRDREGYTAEERMKRRPKREIHNKHLLDIKKYLEKKERKLKRKKKKIDRDPMPGRIKSRVIFSRDIFRDGTT